MGSTPFISWLGHGAASLAPPGIFTGVNAHFFAIEASSAAMQGLTDALLNRAAGAALRYRTVGSTALLSFMDIARCTSGVDRLGWVPGRECAIWVPLLEEHAGDPLATRLVFWAPYIFIDYTIGMLTGREVWGWPKVWAEIAMMSDSGVDRAFSCRTMIFPTIDPETRGQVATLYRVVATGASGETPPRWRSGREAADAFISSVLGGVAPPILARLRSGTRIPSVVLKQFRDVSGSDACFQAIVESPLEITEFRGGGLDGTRYELQVTTCESHQIVQDFLGQAPGSGQTILPMKWAAWVSMDFAAPAGRNLSLA